MTRVAQISGREFLEEMYRPQSESRPDIAEHYENSAQLLARFDKQSRAKLEQEKLRDKKLLRACIIATVIVSLAALGAISYMNMNDPNRTAIENML